MKNEVKKTLKEKDLGFMADRKLVFEEHMARKINVANRMTGILRRAFSDTNEETFKRLRTTIVRPHLENVGAVWRPYEMKGIDALDNVQGRAARLMPGLKDMTYEERLKRLNLPTLTYRGACGEVTETNKIMAGIYDGRVSDECSAYKGKAVPPGVTARTCIRRDKNLM